MSDKKFQKWHDLRAKRWFRWSTEGLMFLILMGGVMWFQTRGHVDKGTPAPQLKLNALSGPGFELAKSDRPSVLFFWAPWCGVCGADAHNIDALRESVGDQANVVSVALSYESLDDVRGFVEEHGVKSPVLLGGRQTAVDWKVNAFPTVYIINSAGEISHSMVGYTTEAGVRARLATLGVF